MQLATIDHQIERIAFLLAKYAYNDAERTAKLAYLKGYVSACLDTGVISVNEYKMFIAQIEAL